MIIKHDFDEFLKYLGDKLRRGITDNEKKSLFPENIYDNTGLFEISDIQMAQYIAEFCGFDYVSFIDPEKLRPGVLAPAFSQKHGVITSDSGAGVDFLIHNPFDTELIQTIENSGGKKISVSEPENILPLLENRLSKHSKEISIQSEKSVKPDSDINPVVYLSDNMLYKAVLGRASDIHIEPKEHDTSVRFRIDGDMQNAATLSKRTGIRLISRFKVLAGLDIAEKRKPQDGSFKLILGKRKFNLRVATTSTPNGESIIMRLLEESKAPKSLENLGMTENQIRAMLDFSKSKKGLLLIVGPTGSGKTTTIYSLLNNIDTKSRSLLSVEDPIEYNIPNANQQAVNDKIGVTFGRLLRSALRQDPDILFIGEIRDNDSASVAVESSSTGHFTVSSMHTSNVVTSFVRMEILGISRPRVAEALVGLVAQKLVKILCPFCRETAPLSEQEKEELSKYSASIPEKAAKPAGCPRCSHTGYLGREAVFEVLKFDLSFLGIINSGKSVGEIRGMLREKGAFLMSDHLIDKLSALKISPAQALSELKSEELCIETTTSPFEKGGERGILQLQSNPPAPFSKGGTLDAGEAGRGGNPHILIVEDDKDLQKYLEKLLSANDYEVTACDDGVDALLKLGCTKYDLILSDINMPGFDGFKLLEARNNKKIPSPIIFLTARADAKDQMSGLKMGAADYITKPFDDGILLFKIKKALEHPLK